MGEGQVRNKSPSTTRHTSHLTLLCSCGYRVVESKGKGQKVEILASKVGLTGGCDPVAYPLAKKQHTLEHLRTVGHLRARTATVSPLCSLLPIILGHGHVFCSFSQIGAVARVRNALAYATHQFFQERGFIYLHTPIITASDCEGAGEMFQITTLMAPPVILIVYIDFYS